MPLVIDGHNLIGQLPGLRLDDPDDERQLVELLRRYLARVKKTGTVVFDRGSAAAPHNLSNRTLAVRFAKPPRTADDVIVDLVRRERNPRGLTVVTSDARLAQLARQAGATVQPAAEFGRALRATPSGPAQKETGLSAEEVAEWEQTFRRRR